MEQGAYIVGVNRNTSGPRRTHCRGQQRQCEPVECGAHTVEVNRASVDRWIIAHRLQGSAEPVNHHIALTVLYSQTTIGVARLLAPVWVNSLYSAVWVLPTLEYKNTQYH